MYISVDNNYLIRDDISNELLNKCFTFIENQSGVKSTLLEQSYKIKKFKKINFPQNINYSDVDIIIKTKFNKDYKFISLDKSIISYQHTYTSGINLKSIKEFQLDEIYFFPKTYFSENLVFQKLAKGIFTRPDKLSNFSSDLLLNIAKVIHVLSSRKKSEIKIENYLDNLVSSQEDNKDPLNAKVINTFFVFLEKKQDKIILKALTHGDFKFEHLFTLENHLEYVIDWENVGIRSIFFDLLNFYIPWFVYRSYNYTEIKKYICEFVQKYLPNLENHIQNNYDIYFSIYALERYKRIKERTAIEFDMDEAYKRYYLLLNKLSKEFNREQ